MPAPPVAAASEGGVAVMAPPAPPKAIPVVDVVAQLEKRAAANPQQLNWRTSIVDLLKLLDIDSSLAARKELATELRCPPELMGDSAKMNVWLHKAVLAKIGLKEGDYTIDQLDMGQHVNAMKAGTFDAGYTLEPNASTMRKQGIARTIESGVIAMYILGDVNGNAFAAGCALTTGRSTRRID